MRQALFVTAMAVLSGCTTASFDAPKTESTYLTDTAQTELGQWAKNWTDANGGMSGFYPVAEGSAAMAIRLGLAERAQKSIDLQYFIMKGDKAGLTVTKSLLEAADRGVRVRLLPAVSHRMSGDTGCTIPQEIASRVLDGSTRI